MSGQESPKPCPRCGSMPVIDPGLEGHEAAPGREYYSCPAILTIDGEEWDCGEHAQGLKAWNYRPAEIARVEEAVRVIADLAGCAKWRAAGEPDPMTQENDMTALQAEVWSWRMASQEAELEVAALRAHRAALQADLAAAVARAEKAEGILSRKGFPILGSRGASIDWQLVADHGEQAQTNHGQTVSRLAERGGLSWIELHAVLHNRRWQKMDSNEAMIACRGLEARYLAALPEAKGEK